MNIGILVVPNEEIKKRKGFTGADWWFDEDGDLQIRIAKMSNPIFEKALSIHEMDEALHCQLQGITVKQVDDFDKLMEEKYPENHALNAGDEPGCPYAKAHSFATAPERVYIAEAGVSWKLYDDEVGSY
jgi:hypothetical protein